MRVVDLASDGQSRALTFRLAKALDPGAAWGKGVIPDATGRRLLTPDGGLRLRDGASGELIATLAEGKGRLSGLFLADGRIVVDGGPRGTEAGPPQATVQVFDPDGAGLGEIPLDIRPGALTLGPEVVLGLVAVSPFRANFLPEDTLLVDVGDRRVVERLSGLRSPAIGFWNAPAAPPAGARPTSVHFFRDVEGRVIRIDFATGQRRIVTGPGAAAGERVSLR
jgi:hypothetical protein